MRQKFPLRDMFIFYMLPNLNYFYINKRRQGNKTRVWKALFRYDFQHNINMPFKVLQNCSAEF